MPKMPESESKEETAESIAEKKEQVIYFNFLVFFFCFTIIQERLKQLEAKQKEKERNEKYAKLKTQAKDDRAKFREKVKYFQQQNINNESFVQYKLEATPTPSDEEDMSSDEEDAFGPKKEKVEEDPVKSIYD